MALIMVDVEEAARRLDELVDEVVEGEEVIVSRDGHPTVLMVPFEGRRRPGAPAGRSAGHAGTAEHGDESGPVASSGAVREVIVERMVGLVVHLR
ncbi:MAG TPA: type II toxin-antitoxin system prevent-host-death family antitoxin [Longimicrobium sp.]|nr:type II toxin-antitoxin system prevent-host-death family antitoxin [Longimicrobium sp.]